MGSWIRRVASLVTVTALACSPSVLSACLALCGTAGATGGRHGAVTASAVETSGHHQHAPADAGAIKPLASATDHASGHHHGAMSPGDAAEPPGSAGSVGTVTDAGVLATGQHALSEDHSCCGGREGAPAAAVAASRAYTGLVVAAIASVPSTVLVPLPVRAALLPGPFVVPLSPDRAPNVLRI